MTILVGTASWSDKSLIDSGKFYPADARSAEDRLRYYASQFPMVEVDSSYYAIPAPETWNKPGLKSSSERFNYDYTEPELRELAARSPNSRRAFRSWRSF